MKKILLTCAVTLMASPAFAQTAGAGPERSGLQDVDLATPAGQRVSAAVTSYTYREPGAQAISIHGPKFGAEYTGTWSLDQRRHWFAQANVRGTLGNVTYDGWCSPFVITPDSGSPNGYALDLGAASPCTENGDRDWYVDGRGLAGKDVIGRRLALAPYTGLGLRHLSNGTTGTSGYRTDDYLYVPLGATVRAGARARGPLSVTLELDVLLHGWQHTRDSALGGGDVPATPTTPPFTIDGFSDISFSQSRGWALRASGAYPVVRHWSIEPYYVRWSVSRSPVSDETATFTVNGITAREQLGAYEPFNTTNEAGVKLGFRF